MIRLGVTGTDTGVGKTVVACGLLAHLRGRGLRVAAMKPVETGVSAGMPADALALRAAAGSDAPLADVVPETFDEPLAPWVAGCRAGRGVDLDRLDAAFTRLAAGRDAIVVEGAGGLLVPVTETLAFDALFARWGLDIVVVAPNRLGVLNHTRLTVQAARAAGLRVRAVVLNLPPTDGASPDGIAESTNADALRSLLGGVPVLVFPTVERVDDSSRLAAAAAAGFDVLLDDASCAPGSRPPDAHAPHTTSRVSPHPALDADA